jgi:hypothetical protein
MVANPTQQERAFTTRSCRCDTARVDRILESENSRNRRAGSSRGINGNASSSCERDEERKARVTNLVCESDSAISVTASVPARAPNTSRGPGRARHASSLKGSPPGFGALTRELNRDAIRCVAVVPALRGAQRRPSAAAGLPCRSHKVRDPPACIACRRSVLSGR